MKNKSIKNICLLYIYKHKIRLSEPDTKEITSNICHALIFSNKAHNNPILSFLWRSSQYDFEKKNQ